MPEPTQPQNPSQAGWLLVTTHPKSEAQAIMNLGGQGYETYQPQLMRAIRHSRRVTHESRALFPGYLFVRFKGEGRWRPILSTRGVRSLIGCDVAVNVIGDDFIAALKAREVDGHVTQSVTGLQTEQGCNAQNPSMDELVGQVIGMRENERIIAVMRLLHKTSARLSPPSSL